MKIYDSLNLIEISKDNLLFNFDYFSKLGKVWPVLKSNAYGHGIKQVTEILLKRDFEYFIVDGYQEVLEIRKITKRPVLMIGSIMPSNFSKIKWKNLAIMIQGKETLMALGNLNKHIKVHLKVNTGMNRQGVDLKEVKKIIKLIKKYPKLELEGIFSHLAGANDLKQIKIFEEVIKIMGGVKYFHLAATGGVKKIKNKNINVIRLGIGLYGIGKGLKPVMKFKSKIVKVRQIEKGEKVSYGGIFTASKKTNIGVIPVGYFEGLDRRLSNKGFIKYKNKFYPIIGNICMNMAVVNFGKVMPKLYDEVEVIGDNSKEKNSIEKMAKIAETIPYDLLVGINSSIRRKIV
jgi:alanine racemase